MATHPRASVWLAIVAAVGTLYGAQGIAPALPAMGHELGVSDAQLGLFTAAYMLPAVLFAVPLGYAADRWGRRRVFVAMALLYSLAGAAQAGLDDYWALLALRFAQGIGFGGLMPLSMTLIGDVLRGPAQLRAQSHRQVGMALGEFALPLVGAALAAVSWHAALAAQGALLPLALGGLLWLAGTRSDRMGQGYARELRGAVGQPGLVGVLTAGFMRMVCKFALVAYLPLLLVNGRGLSVGQTALVLSLASGVAAAVNLVIVRLLARVPASRLLRVAVVFVGAALLGFAVVPNWPLALAVAVLFGLADGTLMVVQNALVTEAAPANVRAGVVAVSGMTRNAGKLVAPLAMGAMILAVPVSAAFALVGVATLATLPALRPVRRLDPLLVQSYPISEPPGGRVASGVPGDRSLP
ncbi:MFS transporter [Solirubrobacter sp. CPCC 204708]|uniref:MFS transporter n=1 Tax=Solirubrobacter deserti TaxID=2282478 RepID=A0ABT4RFA0_9ACTN|nr:MFS transporter [Solirubrobacter deserti]MBE2319477.1 MFS transporter [Solirubrobacter deserti]MDA0137236.1 MFS transporter [Solirubrobacter deserti]